MTSFTQYCNYNCSNYPSSHSGYTFAYFANVCLLSTFLARHRCDRPSRTLHTYLKKRRGKLKTSKDPQFSSRALSSVLEMRWVNKHASWPIRKRVVIWQLDLSASDRSDLVEVSGSFCWQLLFIEHVEDIIAVWLWFQIKFIAKLQ